MMLAEISAWSGAYSLFLPSVSHYRPGRVPHGTAVLRKAAAPAGLGAR